MIDPWSAIDALTSLQAPVKSSLMVCENISDVQGSFFEVPAKHKGQKPILFGRIESKPVIREDSKSEVEPPQFSYYEPNVLRMMENMEYDLMKKSGLNFSKGR